MNIPKVAQQIITAIHKKEGDVTCTTKRTSPLSNAAQKVQSLSAADIERILADAVAPLVKWEMRQWQDKMSGRLRDSWDVYAGDKLLAGDLFEDEAKRLVETHNAGATTEGIPCEAKSKDKIIATLHKTCEGYEDRLREIDEWHPASELPKPEDFKPTGEVQARFSLGGIRQIGRIEYAGDMLARQITHWRKITPPK